MRAVVRVGISDLLSCVGYPMLCRHRSYVAHAFLSSAQRLIFRLIPWYETGPRSIREGMAPGTRWGYGRAMKRWDRLLRLGTRLGDVAIPAVLAALALNDIWGASLSSPPFHGPRGVQTAGALLMTVPLGWRRRYPIAVLCCVLAGAAVEWPWMRSEGQLSFEAFISALVAWYSVGAHADPRRGSRAALIAAVPLVAADVADDIAGYHSPFDDIALYILLAAAWGLGNAFHRHGTRERELEAHAAALEREREQKALLAAAEERARIARELHDVVAHSVSVMVVQVGAARGILDTEPATARDSLLAAERTGREALAEMRRMLGIVRQRADGDGLAPQPGLAHIEGLLERARHAGLEVDLCTEGDPHALPPGLDLAAYRIVQESLTNAVKHAGRAHATVLLRYAPDRLEIEVRDDGRGPSEQSAEPGHGLVGMRERVALYGGALDAGAADGGGFAVRARLPVDLAAS
jgi:signal transduction histidine kinase